MKILLLLLVTACSTYTEGEYKRKFHLADYKSPKSAVEVHTMLTEKMTKCYTQSDYPLYEKTVSKFDAERNVGFIKYDIDNQTRGPRTLVMVEVMSGDEDTPVRNQDAQGVISDVEKTVEKEKKETKLDSTKALPQLEVKHGSLVKVYSKGDLFHADSVYQHQIQKWIDGMTVDCHAHGDI